MFPLPRTLSGDIVIFQQSGDREMSLPVRNLKEYENTILHKALSRLMTTDKRRTASSITSQVRLAVRFIEDIQMSEGVFAFHKKNDFSENLKLIKEVPYKASKAQVVELLEKTKSSIEALINKINGA
ncbi:hypothetical protein NIAMH_48 [Serratia phage vB_SmaS_Niamh]|uniref:Uncharacterized protein n=1 Tax=Serratia phage vB_SmaS_Ulliraptor TaxID=2902694 RepID=A0AC61TPF1_9CAUD|nr:hypothetical protein QJS27_gp46 [Serratia phage vB_SmaS_Ulliraptor]UGO52038.1 hypothetical protein ULLIRAPTOR_46 [Serratia phage vB_SmaS_Ulliraptor]UGO53002.1 hypothetical protein NIAMH_48 [Serratia phage vB_SmaS_Niamh]